MKATLFIPEPGSFAHKTIDPRSGIVGTDAVLYDGGPDGRIVVDYEGNRYGAANIRTYADRCYHAWGRQSRRYPTLARLAVPRDELLQVGWLTDTDAVLVHPAAYGRLAEWLGYEDVIPPAELLPDRGMVAA